MFNINVKKIVVIAALMVSFLAPDDAATASIFDSTCSAALEMNANDSVWSAGYDEAQSFDIYLAKTGILMLDVSSDSPAGSPRLVFLGRGCSELASGEDFTAVEQGAAYQVIAIRAPGTYSLRVMSAGIGQMLGKYELRSSFAPAEIVEEETATESGQGRRMLVRQTQFFVDPSNLKSELEVVDPNPDGIVSVDSLKSELEVVDPNPDGIVSVDSLKSELEVVDPNPDGIVAIDSLKSELEVVDPNPDGIVSGVDRRPVLSLVTMISQSSGTILARLALFPDESRTEYDIPLDGAVENDTFHYSPLKWLAGILPSDSTQ